MAMPQSSSSSFSYGFTYDVFLNFRGTDTRYSVTGNIYRALSDAGIHTFFDDRELHGGDEITPSLLKAIEKSRILIPVFSVNYASSSFCLDELVHIIHCFETKGCLVLPIFYDVEPSHVRHQTESYGKALAKHDKWFQNNKEKLHKWKMALNKAASLSGYHFNPRNEYEYKFIEKMVKYVSNRITRAPLHVVDYPVGLQCRTLKVNNSLLEVGSNDKVKMLGIYGPGGMDVKKVRLPRQRLISNKKVKGLKNVEAFSLRVADIEEVTQGSLRYESPYWIAATRIQAAWGVYWKKRQNLSNHY